MIWLVGQKGMLGTELKGKLTTSGIPFYGTDIEVDITDQKTLKKFAENKEIDWIINCSAYTAVDRAEEETEKAYSINETGAGNLAEIAAEKNAKLIHISTDYVFPGTEDCELTEDDKTGPVSIYGKSKLAGENLIKEVWEKHYIIRTAWLYGEYGANFVNTMLRLMEDKEEINVVNDQIGSPSWAADLADVVIKFMKNDKVPFGVYHFSNKGRFSWFEFAQKIYNKGKSLGKLKSDCRVLPVSSDKFPTKAKRPAFSLLSKKKIERELGFSVPDWEQSLEKYLKGNDKL